MKTSAQTSNVHFFLDIAQTQPQKFFVDNKSTVILDNAGWLVL